jgi:hypothetical protein
MPASVMNCCLPRIGSIAGSRFSSISSTKHGFPFLQTEVISLKKFFVVNFRIIKPSSLNIVFIHLFACCYGSMQSPYLSACVHNIPFSCETASVGSVAILQFLNVTGSPKILTRVKSSLVGILSSRHYSTQSVTIFSLYVPVNGPK